MPEMEHVDKNENVALEACEFWLTFAEDVELAPFLQPLLGKVDPVLLDCMIYGKDSLLWLEGDAEDAAVPDKEADIKPRYYGAKSHGFEQDANGEPIKVPKARIGAYGEATIDSDDDDDYMDDEFVDEMPTEWNLWKCAAAALDFLRYALLSIDYDEGDVLDDGETPSIVTWRFNLGQSHSPPSTPRISAFG